MVDTRRKTGFPKKAAVVRAAAAILLLASCASGGAPSVPCEGTITDDTGESLVSVRIAPAGTDMRLAELLESPLASGETRAFFVENLPVRYWDVFAAGESGGEYALWAVFLAKENALTFTRDDRIAEDDSE
jgi:hypothetical protein